MPKYSKNGFTLVELLVVIAVVAVLSTVGIVAYSGVQKTARDTKRMQDLREGQKALEQYYAVSGSYPVSGGSVLNGVSALNVYFAKGAPPVDPTNNSEYFYGYFAPCGSTNSTAYLVCVKLENCGSNCGVASYPPPYQCPIVPVTTGTKQYYCLSNLQGSQ